MANTFEIETVVSSLETLRVGLVSQLSYLDALILELTTTVSPSTDLLLKVDGFKLLFLNENSALKVN